MRIYIVVVIMLFCLNIYSIFSKKNNKIAKKLSFGLLNYFMCLNYLNGIDWIASNTYFVEYSGKSLNYSEIIKNIPEYYRTEILYYYILAVFKYIGFNYEITQYILLTFVLVNIYIIFSKYTKLNTIGITFFYMSMMYWIFFEPLLRQLIVFSLFLIGLNFLERKKYLIYVCLMIICIFIHSSSVVLILLPLFLFKEISLKKKCVIVIIWILIGVNSYNILNMFKGNLLILEKYIYYIEIGKINNFNIIALIKIILTILVMLFISKNKNILNMNKRKQMLLENLVFINLLLFIARRYLLFVERFQVYFYIFFIIEITIFIEVILKKYNKVKGIIVFLLFFLYFFKVMFLGISQYKYYDRKRYIPYTNYIEEILNQDKEISLKEKIIRRFANQQNNLIESEN